MIIYCKQLSRLLSLLLSPTVTPPLLSFMILICWRVQASCLYTSLHFGWFLIIGWPSSFLLHSGYESLVGKLPLWACVLLGPLLAPSYRRCMMSVFPIIGDISWYPPLPLLKIYNYPLIINKSSLRTLYEIVYIFFTQYF